MTFMGIHRLSDTQNLEGLGDQVTVLSQGGRHLQAGQISQALEQAAGKGFMATNWMEQNKSLFVRFVWKGSSLS